MESYTLYFPFRLAPNHEIKELDKPYATEISGFSLKISKESDFYSLTMSKLTNEEDGKLFLRKLWSGLMWAMLNQELSPDASLSFQEIQHYKAPIQAAKNISKSEGKQLEDADISICKNRPAIYPSGVVVHWNTLFAPSITLPKPPNKTIDYIVEALKMPSPEHVPEDLNLKLALDLYNAFFRESSKNARFLTLIMALEALAPSESRHECAVTAIDEWVEKLQDLQSLFDKKSEEWKAYNSLIGDISRRKKEKSHRSRIRSLVYSALRCSDAKAEELSEKAVDLYDMRGTLVHTGQVKKGTDLGRAVEDLRYIVVRVLKARFLQISCST